MSHTLDAVAQSLAVSRRTVEQWINAGELRAVNVSRDPASRKPRLRVLDSDLQAFLAGRTVATEQKQPQRRGRRRPAKQYV